MDEEESHEMEKASKCQESAEDADEHIRIIAALGQLAFESAVK